MSYIYDIFSEKNYLCSLYEIQWNEGEMLMVDNIRDGMYVSMSVWKLSYACVYMIFYEEYDLLD